MRRALMVIIGLAAGYGGAAFVNDVANAGSPYPSPPDDDVPEVPAGECELTALGDGGLFDPEDPDFDNGDEPTIIVKCGITDETSRIFEMPLGEDEQYILRLFVENFLDDVDDKPRVH